MVFKALVDAIIKYKRDPDDVFSLNTINTLKRELQHDLTQAFDSSKYLIEKNATLFWNSKSFLDFLLKLNDLPTEEFRPTIDRDSLRQEFDDYRNKMQRFQKQSDDSKKTLENDLEYCRQENTRLQEQVQDLKRHLNHSNINTQSLKDQLKTAREGEKKLMNQLYSLMEENRILKNRYDTLETDLKITQTNNAATQFLTIKNTSHDVDNQVINTQEVKKVIAPTAGLFPKMSNGGALDFQEVESDFEMFNSSEEDLKAEVARKNSELEKCLEDLKTTKSELVKIQLSQDELKQSYTQVDAKVTELEKLLNVANELVEKQAKELSFFDKFNIKETLDWETITQKYEDNKKKLEAAERQLKILKDVRHYVDLNLENFGDSLIDVMGKLPFEAPKLDEIAQEAKIPNDDKVVENFKKYIREYNDYKRIFDNFFYNENIINPEWKSDTDFLKYVEENHKLMASLHEQVTTFNEEMGKSSDWLNQFIVWFKDQNLQFKDNRLEEIAQEANIPNDDKVVEKFKDYIRECNKYKKKYVHETAIRKLALRLNANWKSDKELIPNFLKYVKENHELMDSLHNQVTTFDEKMGEASDWLKQFVHWFSDRNKRSQFETSKLEELANIAEIPYNDKVVEILKKYIKEYTDYLIKFHALGFDTIDKAWNSWTVLKHLAVELNKNQEKYTEDPEKEDPEGSEEWFQKFMVYVQKNQLDFENSGKIIKELSELTPDIPSDNKCDWKDTFIKRYNILTSFANFFMDEKKIDYSDDENLKTKVFDESFESLGKFFETLKKQASNFMPEIVQKSNWVKLYIEKLSDFVELHNKNIAMQPMLPFDQWASEIVKKDFESRKSKLKKIFKTRPSPYSTKKGSDSSESTKKESSNDSKLPTLEIVGNYFNLKTDKLDEIADHVKTIFQELLLDLKVDIPDKLTPQEYENAKFRGYGSPFVTHVSYFYLVLKYTIDKQASIIKNNLEQMERFNTYYREWQTVIDLTEELPMEQFTKKLKENLEQKVKITARDALTKRKIIETEIPSHKATKMQPEYTNIEIQNLFSSIYKAYFTLKLETMTGKIQNEQQIVERVERKLEVLNDLKTNKRDSEILTHLMDYVYYDLNIILGKKSSTFSELTRKMPKMLYIITNHTEQYLSAVVRGETLPESIQLEELEKMYEDENV